MDDLRNQVVEGRLSPGQRLPSRRELEKAYGVSPVTLQRAMDSLVRDGFLTPALGRGTFVAEFPPHLFHYALLFPAYPGTDSQFPRFWTAMANEAVEIQRGQRRKVSVCYGIDGHSDTEDYQRLLRDVAGRRLAGLIFSTPPYKLAGTPLVDEPGIPRVAVMGLNAVAGIPAVTLDAQSFIDKALDHLVKRGRRRVALLGPPALVKNPAPWAAGLAERRMKTRAHWVQAAAVNEAICIQNAVHAVMCSGQAVRPDAVVITDDNLVEHATAGLIDAGIKVPHDVEVVAHCNFPWPTPTLLPVRRLGYDSREVLHRCMEIIDAQRKGSVPAPMTRVTAKFEDEVVDG